MSPVPRAPLRTLGCLALALTGSVLGGCGASSDGGGEVEGDRAAAALQRQREEVRAATAELLEATAAHLPGVARSASGGWRGCESGGIEEFRSFRYVAQARVDAGPDARRPYLHVLRPVLDDLGYSAEEPVRGPGGGSARRLPATRAALTASVSEVPDSGDYVLLTVTGDCVEVPRERRAEWLTKDDPTPIG